MQVETPKQAPLARRLIYATYAGLAYLWFVGTLLYAMLFVMDLLVPKTINTGATDNALLAALINAGLLGLFAVQHSVMARPWFKRLITRVIPKPLERATFVYATCAVFTLMFWQWRAMPETVWRVQNEALANVVFAIGFAGWGLALYSTFAINHFDLFGLRQVALYWAGKPYTHPGFATPVVYRMVRNPLMLGFLIAFWVAPHMTVGRLLFCLLTTGYILVGIAFEERDLLAALGEKYRTYRQRTPMLIPIPRRRAPAGDANAVSEVESVG